MDQWRRMLWRRRWRRLSAYVPLMLAAIVVIVLLALLALPDRCGPIGCFHSEASRVSGRSARRDAGSPGRESVRPRIQSRPTRQVSLGLWHDPQYLVAQRQIVADCVPFEQCEVPFEARLAVQDLEDRFQV
jgi:hypothetical protein